MTHCPLPLGLTSALSWHLWLGSSWSPWTPGTTSSIGLLAPSPCRPAGCSPPPEAGPVTLPTGLGRGLPDLACSGTLHSPLGPVSAARHWRSVPRTLPRSGVDKNQHLSGRARSLPILAAPRLRHYETLESSPAAGRTGLTSFHAPSHAQPRAWEQASCPPSPAQPKDATGPKGPTVSRKQTLRRGGRALPSSWPDRRQPSQGLTRGAPSRLCTAPCQGRWGCGQAWGSASPLVNTLSLTLRCHRC